VISSRASFLLRIRAILLSNIFLQCLLSRHFQVFLSTQIIEGKESKIEGVVSRWVEVVDIVGLSCHHAMRVDVIASESPIKSMVDVSPS
jgi:hypothetical protein